MGRGPLVQRRRSGVVPPVGSPADHPDHPRSPADRAPRRHGVPGMEPHPRRTHRPVAGPTFVVGDPWLAINTASVPFWAFFSVQPALAALEDHLSRSDPYAVVRLLLFQHGTDSRGIARPADWARVITAHGARPDFLGLDTKKFPHDIGFLGRYGPALDRLDRARRLWSALPLADALTGLAAAGLSVEIEDPAARTERGT
jgi:hypothetical protein